MADTGAAMKETIRELESLGYDISSSFAIDLFARSGDWQTQEYSSKVSHITAWEISSKFLPELKMNLPRGSKIEIGDSHKLIRDTTEKFDLIVSDNPMGCYGNYCEHFDIFHDALKIMKDSAIICVNVKTEPFNYEDKVAWQARRNSFYGIEDASSLGQDFVVDFYKNEVRSSGRIVDHVLWKQRPQEPGLYLLTLCTRLES